ncbi:MAG: response regulator [Phycisphaerae bacterium]
MKKALIVDDEKDLLQMLGKRLTASGYSVITATNGRDAIVLAKSQHPDIIVLDIVMPQMDGGQVAAELKEHPSTRNIPVILLTALFSKAEEEKYGSIVGGNITLAKPFDAEKLLEQIKKLLDSTAVL